MADEQKRKNEAGSFDPSKTRFHGSELLEAPRTKPVPPPLPPRVQPDWQSKTRLLPIELLMPEMSSRAAPLEQTCKLEAPAAPPRRWLTKQRVYAWSACLVLWVTVAAASGAPSTQELGWTPDPGPVEQAVTIRTAVPEAERRRAPSQPAAAKAPAGSVEVQPSGRAARPPSAAPAASPAQPAPLKARVSQRAAVEALAAGDTLAAAQFYAALARQHPDNPAFARAARILMQRREPHDVTEGGAP